MFGKVARLCTILAMVGTLGVLQIPRADAQTNVNKVFASGEITAFTTIEPVTGISVPDKTLLQLQVYKNSYGAMVGRMSYTDSRFTMLSSGRVKVLGLTSTQAKLLFVVTYKTSSDLFYVTINKSVSSTGVVSNSISFYATDYFGKIYPELSKTANLDKDGTAILSP